MLSMSCPPFVRSGIKEIGPPKFKAANIKPTIALLTRALRQARDLLRKLFTSFHKLEVCQAVSECRTEN